MMKFHAFSTRFRILFVVAWVMMVAAPFSWPQARRAAADSGPNYRTNEILVRLNPTGGATIADINTSYGTTTLGQMSQPPGAYRLQVPNGQDARTLAATMTKDVRLLYAQLNYLHEPPEANPRRIAAWGGFDSAPYNNQYALAKLGIPQAQAISQGEGVTVAIIDTGVQLAHPILSDTLTTARKDFVDDDNVPNDDFDGIDNDGDGLIDEAAGHGTHVAGIVHLVAPKAKIMPLRVLDSDGHGDEFSVGKAIEYAKENKADIINLSLGSLVQSKFIEEEIKDATESGILVIAAAGNLNVSDPHYPASGACALAVASVGADDVKSDFSNFGSWVDVVAPGESIYSTFPITGFATWSGTSMSTPFVVGQAALIRSKNSALNPRQVAILIAGTADTIDVLNPSLTGLLGYGRINILASLNKLATGTLPNIPDILSGNCEEHSKTATPQPQTTTPTPTGSPAPTQIATLTPKPTNTKTPTPFGTPATQTPVPTPSATPAFITSSTPSKLIAMVSSMPTTTLMGAWVIGGVSYQAFSNTQFDSTHGPFANGACLGATYVYSSAVLLLSSLETLESYKCQTTSGGTTSVVFQNFGVVESRPSGAGAGPEANVWRVGGITFTTNTSTAMAETNGKLSLGAFVELHYRVVNGARVASRIETHIAPGQGPKTTAGKLTTRPNDAWGIWVIGGESYLGDHAIEVDLASDVSVPLAAIERAEGPDAGRLIWVNYYVLGSQRYATWVRELSLKVFLPVVQR